MLRHFRHSAVLAGLIHCVADPFADVCGTIVEPDSARLAPCEEAHCFAIDELHLLEVEYDWTIPRLGIDEPLQLGDMRHPDAAGQREPHRAVVGATDSRHRHPPGTVPWSVRCPTR